MKILKMSCILVLSIVLSTSTALAEERELYYNWTDIYKYQDNMTCTAIVKLDGEVLTNCELAAFDENDELRGSILSNDDERNGGRCYLTIQGEGSTEILHFRVVYGPDDDSRIIADAQETFTFTANDKVGSYSEPFVFNITTGEDTGIYNINENDGSTRSPQVDTGAIYDLSGHRINNLMHNTIYIQNGVKRLAK